MNRTLSVVVCLFMALLQCATCAAQQNVARLPQQRLKDETFKFRLPDLDGKMIASGDKRFKDKVVLFDIWGTWCPPCVKMTPFLNQLHEKYAAEGLEIVGAAFERKTDDQSDPKDRVAAYVANKEIDYTMLYAGAADIVSSLVFLKLPFREFDGFPTVVVVARDGTPKIIEEGFDEKTAERLEALVEKLLAEK